MSKGGAADPSQTPRVANVLAAELLRGGQTNKAKAGPLLDRFADRASGRDAIEAGILSRRADLPDLARRLFEQAGAALLDDPRGLLEYCQNKLELAGAAHRPGRRGVNRRLLDETETLLRRVLRLDTHPVRHARAWREMARTLEWLGRPSEEVAAAYRRAIDLAPREDRFRDALREYEQRAGA